MTQTMINIIKDPGKISNIVNNNRLEDFRKDCNFFDRLFVFVIRCNIYQLFPDDTEQQDDLYYETLDVDAFINKCWEEFIKNMLDDSYDDFTVILNRIPQSIETAIKMVLPLDKIFTRFFV